MQDDRKAVWSIPYVSVAFFPSLKQNFIAYRSSKVSSHLDWIFEIHQRWQSGFSRVYSNCCCSCWFEPEIIEIDQSSDKMYNNNILNFQKSTLILNAHMKKVWKPIVCTSYICILRIWHIIFNRRFAIKPNQNKPNIWPIDGTLNDKTTRIITEQEVIAKKAYFTFLRSHITKAIFFFFWGGGVLQLTVNVLKASPTDWCHFSSLRLTF